MLSLNKDSIHYIVSYCDDFSAYFLMQTCTSIARIIRTYDINVLGIEAYSILNDAPNILDWFGDMKIHTHHSASSAIIAAISKHKNTLADALLKKYEDLDIDVTGALYAAIRYHNDDYLDSMSQYLENNYKILDHAVKYSNVYAYHKLQAIIKIDLFDSILMTAINNNDVNMLRIIVPKDKCICYLCPFNDTIRSLCEESEISHHDINLMCNIINNEDKKYMSRIIRANNSDRAIWTLLDNICIKYIKDDNIKCVKFILNFRTHATKYTEAAIKYDRFDILKYLYSINCCSRTDMYVAFDQPNIEITRWILSQYPEIVVPKLNRYNYERVCQLVDLTNSYLLDSCVDLHIIKYVRKCGSLWTDDMLYNAICYDNWHVFKYAYNNGCPSNNYLDEVYETVLTRFGPKFCV